MSYYDNVRITAGTGERKNETSVSLSEVNSILQPTFWVNGPYEHQPDEPASLVISIQKKDEIPDGWNTKEVVRDGSFSAPIPYMVGILSEVLEKRSHQLSNKEFKRLIAAAVEALKPAIPEK